MAFHLTGAIAGGGVLLRAIVFDFFGTLTDPTRESGRRTAYNATARVIGIPGEKFWQAVTDSYTERATGVLGGTTETLTELARRCGFEPSAQTIADAARTHYEGARYVQERAMIRTCGWSSAW